MPTREGSKKPLLTNHNLSFSPLVIAFHSSVHPLCLRSLEQREERRKKEEKACDLLDVDKGPIFFESSRNCLARCILSFALLLSRSYFSLWFYHKITFFSLQTVFFRMHELEFYSELTILIAQMNTK